MSSRGMSRRSLLGTAAAAALLAGCGDDGGSGGSGGEIEWWHIAPNEPMRGLYAGLAQQYQSAHPGVTFKITPMENEAFKAKLTTVTQSGKAPDIFHTWGGGVLQQQVDAGLVKEITADIAPWAGGFTPIAVEPYLLGGKNYAVPVDFGMVGFWYNKELFDRAGIAAPPATWAEFLEGVRKLKTAGSTPLALAGKEKWPGHYYWAYLAMRVAGLEGLRKAFADKMYDTPDFVAAGSHLADLVALQPFQRGFLGAGYSTADGQAATMGNGRAAMELMGQWAPGVEVTSSSGGKGLGDKLGFFPFPAVDGGRGSAADAFGGGGGFAVGRDAPAAAVDFLKFISQADNQRKLAREGQILPTVKDAADAVTDPHLKQVADTLAKATGFQLYLDQALPPAVGQQINDSVAELIAGRTKPDQVAKTVTEVARR